MKGLSYFFVFFLFLPFVLGVAVTPINLEGSSEFVVVNNLDSKVDYVVNGDFVCEPSSFSLGAKEMQSVSVQGTGVGEIIVYEVVDVAGIGLVNGVVVSVDNSVSNKITGDAVFDFSSYSNSDYSWLSIVLIICLVLGIVAWKNRDWIMEKVKNS